MRFLRRFEKFNEELVNGPEVKPTPTTKPGTKPGRPSPIRRERPSVDPRPKAEEENGLPTASAEDVVKRFISLLNDEGEDVEKYVEKK